MAGLKEKAQEIAGVVQNMRPGEVVKLSVSGYLLCQGVISAFLPDEVNESVDLDEFDFIWNNNEAQRVGPGLLPLIIIREIGGEDNVQETR